MIDFDKLASIERESLEKRIDKIKSKFEAWDDDSPEKKLFIRLLNTDRGVLFNTFYQMRDVGTLSELELFEFFHHFISYYLNDDGYLKISVEPNCSWALHHLHDDTTPREKIVGCGDFDKVHEILDRNEIISEDYYELAQLWMESNKPYKKYYVDYTS